MYKIKLSCGAEFFSKESMEVARQKYIAHFIDRNQDEGSKIISIIEDDENWSEESIQELQENSDNDIKIAFHGEPTLEGIISDENCMGEDITEAAREYMRTNNSGRL